MKIALKLREFNREESGQDLVEYALVLAAVAVAVVAGSKTISNTLGNAITAIDSKISSAIAAIS
jgi:pilus assembly protein Flp/PilA